MINKSVVVLCFLGCMIGPVSYAEPLVIESVSQMELVMQQYHAKPNKLEMVTALLDYFSKNPEIFEKKPTLIMPLKLYFSCIAKEDKAIKKVLKKRVGTLNEPLKAYLQDALKTSPKKLLSQLQVSVTKNDMLWAGYFATADLDYLEAILDLAEQIDTRGDIDAFAAGFTAQRTLALNAKTDVVIHQFLEQMVKEGSSQQKKSAQYILETPIEDMQNNAKLILKSWNKSPGVQKRNE